MLNKIISKPQSIDLLITGGCIVTLNNKNSIINNGSIAINNTKIVEVGNSNLIDKKYEPKIKINSHGFVVMPGLINIHGHASNSLIRGLGKDLSLNDWLEKVCWPVMDHADDEDIYNGVKLSCTEQILNGITTFTDMWRGVGIAAEAVSSVGLRAVLAHNIKDFGDIDRGVKELEIAFNAWEKWDGYANGRVLVGFGPHSVYTCEPIILANCAELASKNNIHIQIHGSETAKEVEDCKKRFGCSPVSLMNQQGILGNRTIVAHSIFINDDDIKLLSESRTSVAHNIISNLILSSGIAPIEKLMLENICVGIGTDGPGTNDGLDLLADLKCAALAQKYATGNPNCLTTETLLRMVTQYGAEAIGLSNQLGSIEAGKLADIILIDFNKAKFTPSHFNDNLNILSHLVYVATGEDVDTVIVGGEILVENRQLIGIKIDEIISKAQKSSEKILNAIVN